MTVALAPRQLLQTLTDLEIPAAIGGSVVPSARGMPRFTRDIDLVVMISTNEAKAFVRQLGKDWYADADAIEDAVRGRAFNVIFVPRSYKFDLFPRQRRSIGRRLSARPT